MDAVSKKKFYISLIFIIGYSLSIAVLIHFLNLISKIKYFTNINIDQKLLQYVNKSFSKFIITVIVILIAWLVWFVYLNKFLVYRKKLYSLFVYFMPIWMGSLNLIEGIRIISHTNNILQPSESTFSWKNYIDFLSTFGYNYFYVPIVFIFGMTIIYIFHLKEYQKNRKNNITFSESKYDSF